MNLFTQLLTSNQFVQEIFADQSEDSNHTGNRFLRDLLHFKGSNNCSSENESVFSLELLSCLVTNLDNYLLLEQKLNFSLLLGKELEGDNSLNLSCRKILYLKRISAATQNLGETLERELSELSF